MQRIHTSGTVRTKASARSEEQEFEGVEPSVRALMRALRALPRFDDDEAVPPSSLIVQADLFEDETPLGLLMDWSMALPVVVQVLPGSAAEMKGLFSAGMTLLVVGRSRIHPGMSRDEVERLLETRPLSLFFEVPDTERFAEVSSSLLALQLQASTSLANVAGAQQNARKTNANKGTMGNSKSWSWLRLQDGTPVPPELPLERSPLSRFSGAVGQGAPPAAALQLPLLQGRGRSSMSASYAYGMAQTATAPWVQRETSRGSSPNPAMGKLQSRSQLLSSAGMSTGLGSTWRAPSHNSPQHERSIDPCYDHLFAVDDISRGEPLIGSGNVLMKRHADGAPLLGPGLPTQWPLMHSEDYTCRIGDMVLAGRIQEAYEKGYRGSKRRHPIALRVSSVKLAENDVAWDQRASVQISDRVVEEPVVTVSCDICGMHLIGPSAGPSLGIFYYCKECKRNGKRFEMCPGCHACEVLQAEGKHCIQAELHPHYSHCTHHGLVRRKGLHAAHPQAPHLRRAFCDYCGQVAAVREAKEGDHELYVCPTCPEENGLRFEMCARCAKDLLTRGWGVQRLRNLGFGNG